MNRTVARYLEKRTAFDEWPLEGKTPEGLLSVIVIPVLDEDPGLFDTLTDLGRCDAEERARTLVIVVVNNREPDHTGADAIAANQRTLADLEAWRQEALPVAWIDASSPGRELPPKDGVGMARKIGLDWGLRIMAQQDTAHAALISLDGDTRIDADYLGALHAFFEPPARRWACVVPYAHPVEGTEAERRAILGYELYLRYHALHLVWAGSPYGYHTIGSALACTAPAYAAVSGMNRRQAGEDFYFLQQLAKTGKVERLRGTTVRPSARASQRAPFGTGRWVQRFLDGEVDEYRLYHPDGYEVLRRWLTLATAQVGSPGATLQAAAADLDQELGAFLQHQGFAEAWDRIRAHSSGQDALVDQFHRWFDGLRTLRLLHHLRDSGRPEQPMFAALAVLLERLEISADAIDLSRTPDPRQQETLLGLLRGIDNP